MGTGTTGVVAAHYGCKFIGNDEDSDCVDLGTTRIRKAYKQLTVNETSKRKRSDSKKPKKVNNFFLTIFIH
jgi:hypothetical protein